MCDKCSTCKWRRDAETDGFLFCWVKNTLVAPKEECQWWKSVDTVRSEVTHEQVF